MGSAILEELRSVGADYQLRCLLRPTSEPRGLPHLIETLPGDLLNPRDVENAIQGCDAVINAVGVIAEAGKNTFFNVHVKALRHTVECSKKGNVKKYILVSALGTREGAESEYHKTKFQGEQILRESGIPFTIFRPSVVFGEKDRFINLLAKMVRRLPIVPVLGDGRNKFQPIYVRELARMVSEALGSECCTNRTVSVGGKKAYSYDQILSLLAELLGVGQRVFLHVPMGLLKFPAYLLKVPINYDQWLMLKEDNVLSAEEYENFRSLFDFEPSTLEEILPNYIKDVS